MRFIHPYLHRRYQSRVFFLVQDHDPSQISIPLLKSSTLAHVLQTSINPLQVPNRTQLLSKTRTVQMEFFVRTKRSKRMVLSSPRRCRLRLRGTVKDRSELPWRPILLIRWACPVNEFLLPSSIDFLPLAGLFVVVPAIKEKIQNTVTVLVYLLLSP